MSYLDGLIKELSDPSIYPHQPRSVQVVQTHISIVFIAGDLVYKVKKPVDFGFLDFTTLEKRKYYCRQEVILNSRFSEKLYLGVVSIYRGPKGLNFVGEGQEIEVAVLMRRVPEDRLMINMLKNEQVTGETLDRLADRLAYFHSLSETGPHVASFGSPMVIYQNLKENFDQTYPFIGRTIDQNVHEKTATLAFKFLRDHGDLFRSRMEKGFIRDCHGDLHLDHVIILDGIMLYDCVEFNDRFRYGDTAADIAFLLMDFDFRGYPAFAERIAARYALSSGDQDVLKLLGFYKSYRAFIRGKVIGFTLDEPEIREIEKKKAIKEARDFFRLALSYLEPPPAPALIITCGLMGTGKSFIAAKLGNRLGIEPIRSDSLRKEIYGLPIFQHELDKFGEGIYTTEATERTYAALLEKADKLLSQGRSVILDASFGKYAHRQRARNLAQRLHASFKILYCIASDNTVKKRLDQRAKIKNEPSDGRWEIYFEQKASFEPIREDEKRYCHTWFSTLNYHEFLVDFVRQIMFGFKYVT